MFSNPNSHSKEYIAILFFQVGMFKSSRHFYFVQPEHFRVEYSAFCVIKPHEIFYENLISSKSDDVSKHPSWNHKVGYIQHVAQHVLKAWSINVATNDQFVWLFGLLLQASIPLINLRTSKHFQQMAIIPKYRSEVQHTLLCQQFPRDFSFSSQENFRYKYPFVRFHHDSQQKTPT